MKAESSTINEIKTKFDFYFIEELRSHSNLKGHRIFKRKMTFYIGLERSINTRRGKKEVGKRQNLNKV